MPQEIKCELCEHESFVRLPGWTEDQIPEDWRWVELAPSERPARLLIGPFCITVARAFHSIDCAWAHPVGVEKSQSEQAEKPGEADV